MKELRLFVPAYYGHAAARTTRELPEFGEALVPVLIRRADGVRIVLGSHDYEDMNFPDIQVERRPNGWAIFLHPLSGGDASGYVYFVDDRRSFVLPEREICGTVPIRCLDPGDQIPPEVDALADD